MDAFKIQEDLLAKIRGQVGDQGNWVDLIADALSLSKPAVYKRINGSTSLSINDLAILMKRFDLSFDSLIHTDRLTVDFHLPTSGNTVKTFIDFLSPIKQFVVNLANMPELQIWHATSELHLFYYFLDKDLTNFKMFLHAKTLWNLKGYEDLKFSIHDFSGSHFIAQEVDEILTHYFRAPNIELWNENIITNTLNQIKYFLISGYFEKPEESLILCEKIRSLIRHLCKMAEQGKKFYPGKEVNQESGDYLLYHNELSYTNNIMLINSPKHDQVFTTYNNPNFMLSSNEKLIAYTKNWFERVKKLSQPVSLDAQQSRMLLFNQIEKKIDLATMEINHLLERLT
ncbi:hypothetical protein [Portibacter lacus]|uniref:HTH cro/C1-type domain-containing protein n=1 Tax=Portibacter lacus TaxID=1099794 RepID=A0AA37SW76_9BACT|nr:hypothetical protein [Portibacter lacus]GLR18920.1 hypothetical protein GCM10007940_35360 [Portibacter lacus]